MSDLNLPFPVKTKRLILRPFESADLREISKMTIDFNDVVLNNAAALIKAREWLSNTETRDKNHLTIGMFSKKNELLGRVSAYSMDAGSGDWELGYYTLSAHREKGYMVEALNGLKNLFRDSAKATGLYATIGLLNKASMKVVKQVGFEEYAAPDDMSRHFRLKF